MKKKILVDAHIHIHDCFDLAKFFNSAKNNFQIQAKLLGLATNQNILLFTESHNVNYFNKLVDLAEKKEKIGCWSINLTQNDNTLFILDNNKYKIFLIAGRQIITKENLEVLALGLSNDLADGQTIDDVIEYVCKKERIPVIPWGVGKWFGKRKKVIERLIWDRKGRIFLGDNGNRPVFWGKPSLFRHAFKNNILNIPGSDPLPFLNGVYKPGGFGFVIDGELEKYKPFDSFYEIISSQKAQFTTYGKLESVITFIYNQLSMQIVKHKRK